TDPSSGDTRHRSIDISADGAASIVQLNSLDTFTDSFGTASGNLDGRWSALIATNGGSITVPNLATLRGIDLSVDATSSIPTTSLRTPERGRFMVTGANVTLPNLATIDGSSFVASNGQLSLPAATAYDQA